MINPDANVSDGLPTFGFFHHDVYEEHFGKGFPSRVSSAAKAMLRPPMANWLVGSRSLNMKVGSIISFGIDTSYTFLD